MESTLFLARSAFPVTAAAGGKDARFRFASTGLPRTASASVVIVAALEKGAGASGNGAKKTGGAVGGGRVPNSNYVVPLDLTPSFCRPLKEILRDLNKRVPDNIIDPADNSIPWYHANRMLSFYAPDLICHYQFLVAFASQGWCGEVRDIIFSDNGNVTVVYRVTIRGLDGEAHRESAGTVSLNNGRFKDPIAAAEELAFCKACARFGFGLHLYHEDETP
ncbi:DNA repair RAD52-like protein 2, chloroplastic isoform X1 [Musa acuminata AAA Group]|uniref:DNA repair RAD52-like protein 2, chloroplastic isoform X1 n=1 Tax=Musa acuminata AAA Group TaxID=214697 RepID=UPI0031D1FCDC